MDDSHPWKLCSGDLLWYSLKTNLLVIVFQLVDYYLRAFFYTCFTFILLHFHSFIVLSYYYVHLKTTVLEYIIPNITDNAHWSVLISEGWDKSEVKNTTRPYLVYPMATSLPFKAFFPFLFPFLIFENSKLTVVLFWPTF